MRPITHRARFRALALLGAWLCAGTPAQAGNLDAFYLSGEAALQGGAIVATTSTGASIWYNPAGLASISRTRLDVNVSGYTVRVGAKANFDSTLPNAVETRLSILDIDVVPAAVALTRRFGDVGIGLGVFVPTQSGADLRTLIESTPDEQGRLLRFGFDATNRQQEYHLGPGIGWSPLSNFDLGFSLLGNYRTTSARTDIAATIESEGEKVSWTRHDSVDTQGFGLEMVVGIKWRFLPNWSLGANMKTPALRLGQVVQEVNSELVADSTGSIDDNIVFMNQFGLGASILTPFRYHVGLAHRYEKTLFSFEGSLLSSFENQITGLEQQPTWNVRAGARTELNEYWSIGGGLFTDRSPSPEPTSFPQGRIDYYGATVAVDWRTAFGVYAQDDRLLEEPVALVFGTTVALSYAVGLGEIAGAQVGPSDSGGIVVTNQNSAVTAHEFTLHIGSALTQ